MYIVHNKNALIITGKCYRKRIFNMDTVSLLLALFTKRVCNVMHVTISKEAITFSRVLWRSVLTLPGKYEKNLLIWEASAGNISVLSPALMQRVSICAPDLSGRTVSRRQIPCWYYGFTSRRGHGYFVFWD